MNAATTEIQKGQRFEFGENWSRFLARLDEDRIQEAERSLSAMLDLTHLKGKSFLDIGSGSGLFSLAAHRLGARVHSFDYDPKSVACTKELKRRFFPDDATWKVEEGSVLNADYLKSLGTFDVVYSWGVLHHTGAMWKALEHAAPLVAENGRLFIAIYNNQGGTSRRWIAIKRLYNRSPGFVKLALVLAVGAYFESRFALGRLARLQNPLPFKSWAERKKSRGMSVWHDLVDWVGGYPFEVAMPEEVFAFFHCRGFTLEKLKTCGGGLGCNEFAFQRRAVS